MISQGSSDDSGIATYRDENLDNTLTQMDMTGKITELEDITLGDDDTSQTQRYENVFLMYLQC